MQQMGRGWCSENIKVLASSLFTIISLLNAYAYWEKRYPYNATTQQYNKYASLKYISRYPLQNNEIRLQMNF